MNRHHVRLMIVNRARRFSTHDVRRVSIILFEFVYDLFIKLINIKYFTRNSVADMMKTRRASCFKFNEFER
jgi:hypothetical protein